MNRNYSKGYRRGFEPGPAVLSPKLTPALIKAGYRPPNELLRREGQLVWLSLYEEKDNATSSDGTRQIGQDAKDDNVQSSGGKGYSNTASEPIPQVKEDNLGRAITQAPNRKPGWPFKAKPTAGEGTSAEPTATKAWTEGQIRRSTRKEIIGSRRFIYRGK